MKRDVGMLWHEKGETRRCLHEDTNSFITPSLHLYSALKFVVNVVDKDIFILNCLHGIQCGLERQSVLTQLLDFESTDRYDRIFTSVPHHTHRQGEIQRVHRASYAVHQ